MPVIGFECHLCKIFIRNENDIEDHVGSIYHLTIYEVNLTLFHYFDFLSLYKSKLSY